MVFGLLDSFLYNLSYNRYRHKQLNLENKYIQEGFSADEAKNLAWICHRNNDAEGYEIIAGGITAFLAQGQLRRIRLA